MKNQTFKRGNVEISITTTANRDGSHTVDVKAVGDKEEVEAVMREIVSSTADMGVPVEMTLGDVNGVPQPLKVSELMGGN